MFGIACGPYVAEQLMEYIEFPKWTHKGDQSKIVNSREELEALGEGWSDHQYAPPKVHIDSEAFQHYPKWVGDKIVNSAEEEAALTSAEPESDERAMLIKIAAEKSIQIDKRWSTDKIRAVLEAS
jgi:hypothetical protein